MEKVIYSRISAAGSEVDNQIVLMKDRWGQDLRVISELKSGRKNRPKLMDLIMTLPSGSTIYIAHSDRLTRSGIFDHLSILAAAKQRGITIESYHQGVLSNKKLTPMEELQAALKAFVAYEESEATSRRILDMFERRRREGKLSGVYLAIANGNHRHAHKEVNPKIAAAIPRMRELRARGMAYRTIVETLNKEFDHKFALGWVHELINRAG